MFLVTLNFQDCFGAAAGAQEVEFVAAARTEVPRCVFIVTAQSLQTEKVMERAIDPFALSPKPLWIARRHHFSEEELTALDIDLLSSKTVARQIILLRILNDLFSGASDIPLACLPREGAVFSYSALSEENRIVLTNKHLVTLDDMAAIFAVLSEQKIAEVNYVKRWGYNRQQGVIEHSIKPAFEEKLDYYMLGSKQLSREYGLRPPKAFDCNVTLCDYFS